METDEVPGESEEEKVQSIQEQTEEHEKLKSKIIGTIARVFIPTLFTILGVIMFLRQGWVLGNAGLGSAILITLIPFTVTGATGLSISTFVINIRIGKGGTFSMTS